MSLIANDGSIDCNIQTLNQLIMEFYLAPFNYKHFGSIQVRMFKMFEKKIASDQESDIIEIFKICLRDYASELLQEFSEENFKQVENLWEIHYRLQATSLKTERLYEIYYGLFKIKTPCPYDFFQIHFDIAKKKRSNLQDSRKVHQQYIKERMKQKVTLVKILQEQCLSQKPQQQNSECNQLKSIQKNTQSIQKQKDKLPTQSTINVRNEFKEFEDRLSKFENSSNKLEPTFSASWTQKYRNLFLKRKK
ncbi:unnamed protein product [Paramecium primaurelia]|uniref:Uncharacterized protein n=1 Tax=Paramecium primaurelia TaxID=5886 RepID=A0A8S1M4Y7_PARPR|nr:unnamed protein product [Paramecium primaurelia]